MLKINKKTFIASRTADNFPYLEVFYTSSKKTIKKKIEVVKFVPNLQQESDKRFVLLRQEVKVVYGKRQVIPGTPDFDKLLLQEDLDLIHDYQRSGTYIFTKNYKCVVAVPKNKDLGEIQDMLNSFKDSCLYNTTSNHPITVLNKNLSEKEIREQLIVYQYTEDDHMRGDMILDRYGKPQYRITQLSLQGHSDVDLRTSIASDFTMPPEKPTKSKNRKICKR